jgi:hypothetical protein
VFFCADSVSSIRREQICCLRTLIQLLETWRPAFSQSRSHRRAVGQAIGMLVGFGRRTLSRAICALGRQQQDWSADYRLHARAEWQPNHLFQGVLENALPFCRGRYVIAAIDDTRLHKTGRHIQRALSTNVTRSRPSSALT